MLKNASYGLRAAPKCVEQKDGAMQKTNVKTGDSTATMLQCDHAEGVWQLTNVDGDMSYTIVCVGYNRNMVATTWVLGAMGAFKGLWAVN